MSDLRVLTRDRGRGKTWNAIEWLLDGHRVRGYPGWSRVLVEPNRAMFMRVREDWWSQIEDFDHRVYTHDEWRRSRGSSPGTEVVIDNAEYLIGFLPGHVVGLTMSGVPWTTRRNDPGDALAAIRAALAEHEAMAREPMCPDESPARTAARRFTRVLISAEEIRAILAAHLDGEERERLAPHLLVEATNANQLDYITAQQRWRAQQSEGPAS